VRVTCATGRKERAGAGTIATTEQHRCPRGNQEPEPEPEPKVVHL
jgi:hypothetical protein